MAILGWHSLANVKPSVELVWKQLFSNHYLPGGMPFLAPQ